VGARFAREARTTVSHVNHQVNAIAGRLSLRPPQRPVEILDRITEIVPPRRGAGVQSDAERKMAIILERESLKWFKPAKGQFQLCYKLDAKQNEYQPDFVAETKDKIFMLEPKAKNELASDELLAKKATVLRWYELATAHSKENGGKAWEYLLIPHDVIADNMSLQALRNHSA